MTPLPPRRRQAPLLLDGAWLVTRTTEGTKEVPGMSVVADPRGFTIVGPETGRERTVPWDQTTGFTCQRPARLPDGSPATVLEVGLANGHVLELLLPVTRVPPSETVVVETELAVMSEQYGGCKPVAEPSGPVAPLSVAQPVAEPVGSPEPVTQPEPVTELEAPPKPGSQPETAAASSQAHSLNGLNDGSSAPSHDSPGLQEKIEGVLSEAPGVEPSEQTPALALRGSNSNGSSGRGSKGVVHDSPVAPDPTTTSPVTPASVAPAAGPPTSSPAAPESASAAPPVSAPSADKQRDEVAIREAVGKATPAISKPAPDPDVPPEPSAGNGSVLRVDVAPPAKSPVPTNKPAAAPAARTTPDPVSEQAPAAGAGAQAESEEADAEEAPHRAARAESGEVAQVGEIERRENRLFTLLVALIGIVVVVLIAELVLILFVLNHNQNPKSPSVSQTTTITHVPRQTTPTRSP